MQNINFCSQGQSAQFSSQLQSSQYALCEKFKGLFLEFISKKVAVG